MYKYINYVVNQIVTPTVHLEACLIQQTYHLTTLEVKWSFCQERHG